MSYLWSFAGLAIGLFGLYSWYVETYTDSPIAALWREMGDRNDRTTSGDSLSPLFISTGFSLFALAAILTDFLPNIRIILIPSLSIAIIGLALIVIGFICFFPFPVPRWADARYWPGLVLWTGCFEGCWLLLVVLCPLARVLVG